jgi:two-component system phosphate regulon response regulator PhoB
MGAVALESQQQLILIAHRDATATASLAYHLAKAGYHVTTASDAREVLHVARAKSPALLVLDPVLRDSSGYEVLEQLRREDHTRDLGVILLGSSRDELDGVRGLTLGADDCVIAPISPAELVLRVGAILRRRTSPRWVAERPLQAGAIFVDRGAHRVTVYGVDVAVTITEFKLLIALIESQGRVCSRQQLLESVWQTKGVVQTRTVDMHLQRLRRKLGAAGDRIETVRGAGYRLRSDGDQPKVR